MVVDEADRGQLMLVGAITIAIIFLGLVSVLNAGLFTANVAPRAGLSTTTGAETFVSSVRSDVAVLQGAVAEESVEGEVYLREPALVDALGTYEGYLYKSVGSNRPAGVSVSLNRTRGRGGLLVDENPETEFDPASGTDASWTLATDVTETDGTVTVYEFPTHNASQTATFTVSATDPDDEWYLDFYWDQSANQAYVQTRDATGVTDTCALSQARRTNSSGVTVSLENGSVVGAPCSVPVPQDALDEPYELSFDRTGPESARAEGTYRLAVNGTIQSGRFNSPYASPYVVPHVEAAYLDVRYTTPQLTYTTTIRSEPVPASVPSPALTGRGLVFVNDTATARLGTLTSHEGRVRWYNVTDVPVIGPADVDLDGDSRVEVPYVDSDGAVRVVDAANESATLTGVGTAETVDTRLAVGTWHGSGPSVFYVGDGGNRVYRVTGDAGPFEVLQDSNNGVSAVSGPGDIDGDDAPEFVYVDGSQQLRYLDDDGTVGVKITNGGVGQNYGPGVGRPHDFDGDGEARIPFVGGSNNLKLIDAAGNSVSLVGGVDKAPIAVEDVDGDGNAEIVYLKGGTAYFLDGVGTGSPTEQQLERQTINGTTPVTARQGPGVA
ncbi:hypothetical protein [Halobaculum sp. P14]|uniref:hypothetical protein n=1 Tax=Halobaculum sp. P14 TaxID=3421638 RepID=UPI003EB980D2